MIAMPATADRPPLMSIAVFAGYPNDGRRMALASWISPATMAHAPNTVSTALTLMRSDVRGASARATWSEQPSGRSVSGLMYTVAAFTGMRAGNCSLCAGQTGRHRAGPSRRAGALHGAGRLGLLRGGWRKLDACALRRRLSRAQTAGLRPLRFHDLRHSFGSLVEREVDTATLKAWMRQAKITTTERYLHAKPRTSDVARLDRAFAGSSEELATDQLNDAGPSSTAER